MRRVPQAVAAWAPKNTYGAFTVRIVEEESVEAQIGMVKIPNVTTLQETSDVHIDVVLADFALLEVVVGNGTDDGVKTAMRPLLQHALNHGSDSLIQLQDRRLQAIDAGTAVTIHIRKLELVV